MPIVFATADRPGGSAGVNLNGETVASQDVEVRAFGDYAEYTLNLRRRRRSHPRMDVFAAATRICGHRRQLDDRSSNCDYSGELDDRTGWTSGHLDFTGYSGTYLFKGDEVRQPDSDSTCGC
jgi:hypothetical protein